MKCKKHKLKLYKKYNFQCPMCDIENALKDKERQRLSEEITKQCTELKNKRFDI